MTSKAPVKKATSKPITTPAPASQKKGSAPAAKGGKAVASAPEKNPLFIARPRSQRIGGDIRPRVDLSRFVRWPKYVRLQRQKKILLQRLKVPPAIHQFDRTLDKNQAAELFKLLVKYQPETAAAKDLRIEAAAKATAAGEAAPAHTGPAPPMLKFGLKHVTTLIEQKKAKLVVIAHDVDPIELVVWLPALCRKMDVPFAIVKGKARLGTLTHKKTTSVVAVTSVHKEDEGKLKTLQDNFKAQFEHAERKWGGGIMGLKTQAKLAKRKFEIEREEQKNRESRRA